MITVLLFAFPFALGIFALIISKELLLFPLFVVIGSMISGCVYSTKDIIETTNCKESSVKVVPEFVYLSDSSQKILKYKGNTIKTLSRNSFEYHVPENLILLDTCDNSLQIKENK